MSENEIELSDNEKQAINEVLSRAEEEALNLEPYESLVLIDQKCRNIWPEWNPSSNTSPPIKVSEKEVKINISTINPDLYSNDNISDFLASINQSLANGSPQKDPGFDPPRKINKDFKKSELKPKLLAQEIDGLKGEVQTLIDAIHTNLKNSPMRSKQNSTLTCSRDENGFEICRLTDNTKNEQNNAVVGNIQFPKTMTKSQAQRAIKNVQREIKEMELENVNLKKQLKGLRKQYFVSKKELRSLQNTYKRMEALQKRMMPVNTNSKQLMEIMEQQELYK